jgi:hypothetical protein
MVERVITSPRNIVDFASYRQDRETGRTLALSARICRHCGAELSEDEREEECSSAFNTDAATLKKFYAD